jgi:CO/xanthine dehydrogenase Mo-binding subunit
MASAQTNNSMLLGIVVSRRARRDATAGPGAAVTEVTYNDQTDTVRVHKYTSVKGRLYIVGLECRCKDKSPSQ